MSSYVAKHFPCRALSANGGLMAWINCDTRLNCLKCFPAMSIIASLRKYKCWCNWFRHLSTWHHFAFPTSSNERGLSAPLLIAASSLVLRLIKIQLIPRQLKIAIIVNKGCKAPASLKQSKFMERNTITSGLQALDMPSRGTSRDFRFIEFSCSTEQVFTCCRALTSLKVKPELPKFNRVFSAMRSIHCFSFSTLNSNILLKLFSEH